MLNVAALLCSLQALLQMIFHPLILINRLIIYSTKNSILALYIDIASMYDNNVQVIACSIVLEKANKKQ